VTFFVYPVQNFANMENKIVYRHEFYLSINPLIILQYGRIKQHWHYLCLLSLIDLIINLKFITFAQSKAIERW